MEKENMFMNESNWNSSGFGVEIQSNEVNSIFNNPNWGNAMDQSDPFESALSSMVSSPVTSNGGENIVLREVIGTLGTICNSGEISPHIGGNNSANTSCYNTPLNSPPKLNLSMMEHQIRGNLNLSVSAGNNLPAHPSLASFAAEPAFVEMAATFSCFGSGNLVGMNGQIGLTESELPYRLRQRMDIGKLSRVSSNQSIKVAGSLIAGQENRHGSFQDVISTSEKNVENGDSREGSSVSEHIPGGEISMKVQNDANSRKRKTIPRGKAKEIPSSPSVSNVKIGPENEESNAKRSKQDEVNGTEKDDAKANAEGNGNDKAAAGNGNQKQTKDKQKPPETPKEYIHVRARRGEATDSHSLAERVRREKINEKMKFLQDLVPGCNKMTGKAVMLNEIINYVESLQHQVEFLSMKLATVNPRLDLNMETLLSKDILQSSGSLPPNVFPAENWPQAFPYAFQSQQGPNLHSSNPCITDTPFPINPRNAAIHQKPIMQLPSADGLSEATSQGSKFWVGDLQSVVQMGLGQNQPQNSHVSSTKMKVEQ